MSIIAKVIKVSLDTLMTIILIIGILFVLLYVIGIEPFVVESGSMTPTIPMGSLSFINKRCKYDVIQKGDVIAFKVSTGNMVLHRVVSISEEGFETKGDANEASDGISTNRKNFMGKELFSIPKIGFSVKLIQTKTGKIVLLTIIVLVLLSGLLFGESKGKRFKEE